MEEIHMPKVAIYARVSTLNQAEEGYSIEGQLASLRKYCSALDWQIYQEYVDPGFSGGSLNRPAIQKLIVDAKSHRFDIVLIYKLDRLSRSVQDTLYLVKDIFDKNKISFVSLNEKIDTSSPMGNLFLTLLASIAEFEREQIKERMMMGKVGRAKSGKAMGWSKVPFGYTYDKQTGIYQINTLQAQIVKRIYRDYLDGVSITKLVDLLNAEGHITKDRPWTYRTVRQALDNVVYTGRQFYQGNVYPGQHEAIISIEDYDKTQAELKRRQLTNAQKFNPRPFRAKYMLSGLLRCSFCGSSMMVQTRYLKYADDYHYYRCVSSIRKRIRFSYRQDTELCQNRSDYLKDDLESAIIKTIRHLQLHPDQMPVNTVKFDDKPLKDELNRINDKLNKLVDLYLNSNGISIGIINQKRDELLQQKEALENKLQERKPKQPELDPKKALLLLSKKNILELPYKEQVKLVKSLISKIEVSPSKMKIHWRFNVEK